MKDDATVEEGSRRTARHKLPQCFVLGAENKAAEELMNDDVEEVAEECRDVSLTFSFDLNN